MISFFGVPPLTLATWMAAAVGAVLVVLLVLAAWNRVLLKMALRNIPRRRAQTVLILFGLMLATLIITASLGVGDTLSYSLQSIQLKQIGGLDEAFTTHPDRGNVQGAGTADFDFFTSAQAEDVIAKAKSDPNVKAAAGAIVAPGSMVDATTDQSSSENVAVFGVPAGFTDLWGPLQSRSGASLSAADLQPAHVYIGDQLAHTLGASPGDHIHLFVDGHPTEVTVRDVLSVEVNPSIAQHGPIVNSVVMPIATIRQLLQRPDGYNVVFVRNTGSGGIDDLGPNGVTGQEITRRMRALFTDAQAADDLRAYLNTPAIKAEVRHIHDSASFLDPRLDWSRRLLVELDKPQTTDEFKSLAGEGIVQSIMFNAVSATVPKSAGPAAVDDARTNLNQMLASLQVDSSAAAQLRSLLLQPDVGPQIMALADSLPASDPGRDTMTQLLQAAQQPAVTPKFKTMASSPELQGLLSKVVKSVAPGESATLTPILGRLDLYQFTPYKADAVVFAQEGGQLAVGALLGVSFFSIAVGVLLIFLIFVMLAAERRAEMGMSRAVGLKRRHLTQMFLFEGMAYTLGASVIGIAGGVLVGRLMISVLASLFTGFYQGLTLTYDIEPTTLVMAICVGILLTFIVVAFSAYKVSRLNIVAAIRDLDVDESRDAGLGRMFTGVFSTAWFGLRQLFKGHPLVSLGRLTLGTLGAIARFWWALFKRGPMTIVLGALLALTTFSAHSEFVYSGGVSLVIVGTGLLIRWIANAAGVRRLVAARIGFTAAAIGLLVYWGRPFGRVEKLLHIDKALQIDKLLAGPEVFALSALMALLGAIWLVMFNSDLLIRGVMFFTGRIAGLAAVTRTSMAYPMSTKFRTGMAVAMFAIVTFMVVFMSVFKDVLIQNFGQVGQASGGWQIVAGTPDQNFQQSAGTAFPTDVAGLVRGNPATAREITAVGWENQTIPAMPRQVRADGTVASPAGGEFNPVHVVDDGYLSSTQYALKPRAAEFSSDRAAWDAVRDHPGYVVLDASLLDSQGGNPAVISGISSSASTFQPFQVQLDSGFKGTSGQPQTWRVTVVGFLVRPTWDGIYMSTRTALQSGQFAEASGSQSAPASAIASAARTLTPTGYYFMTRPGADVNKARLDLGRVLVKDQLEPVVVADQVAQGLSGILTLLNLITGFLALGLIVGIAGLGVISTRAVVERWQQIGMLRALGYRRSLVQRSFLMESSLIAILGLAIGALVGVWQSYRFFVTDQTFGRVDFHVPVIEILLILVGSYLATLLTTFLPARSASRVAPAEALRYE
ncbi:MAG TPA: FtsX-like permease family protein [Candidatus Dormibacteraeota bacterium]